MKKPCRERVRQGEGVRKENRGDEASQPEYQGSSPYRAHIGEAWPQFLVALAALNRRSDEKIAETVDILIRFVRPERREAVRIQILDLLRREANTAEER